MSPGKLKPVAGRPAMPDGVRYEFNCCARPDVWEYDDGSSKCACCGHDWTEALGP